MYKKTQNTFLKIIITFLPVLFFSFFNTNTAFSAKLTVTDLYSNSVTLQATELKSNQTYVFKILNPFTGELSEEVTTGSSVTEVTSTAFNYKLVANQSYAASIMEKNGNFLSNAFSMTFDTPVAQISYKDKTSNSITLNVYGLVADGMYQMVLEGGQEKFEKEEQSSIEGSLSIPFSGLKPDTEYSISAFRLNITTGEYTFPSGVPVISIFTDVEIGGSNNNNNNNNNSSNNNNSTTETYKVGIDQAFLEKKSLVPCGNDRTPIVKDTTGKETGGEVKNKCTFDHVIIVINRVVNFLLFYLAIPLAAIMFAYAGFLFLLSAGDSGKRTKAKGIFLNVVLGLVFAAAAWLVIHTILSILGYDGSWIGF